MTLHLDTEFRQVFYHIFSILNHIYHITSGEKYREKKKREAYRHLIFFFFYIFCIFLHWNVENYLIYVKYIKYTFLIVI